MRMSRNRKDGNERLEQTGHRERTAMRSDAANAREKAGMKLIEDKELIRRYGATFETYVKSKPMFFPRLRDLGSLVRLVLSGS